MVFAQLAGFCAQVAQPLSEFAPKKTAELDICSNINVAF